MEWKSISKESPQIGHIYVVVDVKGSFSLREYRDVFITERGRTKHWNASEPELYEVVDRKTMFTPVGREVGPVPRKDLLMFFCEVPEPPGKLKESKEIRDQIKALERELEKLGG